MLRQKDFLVVLAELAELAEPGGSEDFQAQITLLMVAFPVMEEAVLEVLDGEVTPDIPAITEPQEVPPFMELITFG